MITETRETAAAAVAMPDAPAVATTPATDKPRQYDKREAVCADPDCGATFTSIYYYSGGWTRFCSRRCAGNFNRKRAANDLAQEKPAVDAADAADADREAASDKRPASPEQPVTPAPVLAPPLDLAPKPTPQIVFPPRVPGTTRTARLRSGGGVTLLVSGNLLMLSREERAFVFSLVDVFEQYEAGQTGARQQEAE